MHTFPLIIKWRVKFDFRLIVHSTHEFSINYEISEVTSLLTITII